MVGRPKGEKSFAAMLRIAIKEAGNEPGTTKLRDIANALVDKAAEGDIQAIKEVADRLDGKPLVMTADVTDKLDDINDESLDAAVSALRAAVGTSEEAGDDTEGETRH